ncbi:MAG: hypothetical protein Q9187_005413, partial [Circinaria calcarea]
MDVSDSMEIDKQPCDKHLRAAHERYSTTLEAVGCICKALIARNLESCCSSIRNRKKRLSEHTALRAKAPGSSSLHDVKATGGSNKARASGNGWGKRTGSDDNKPDGYGERYSTYRVKTDVHGKETNDCVVKSGCCGEKTNHCGDKIDCCPQKTDTCQEKIDCCGGATDTAGKAPTRNSFSPTLLACNHNTRCSKASNTCSKTASCATPGSCSPDGCCGKLKRQNKDVRPIDTSFSGLHDIEKGTATTEHVTLNVEGLTCVGCENKLFRSLNAIPGIHSLQTSLVMSQAEFDLDTDAGSVSEVIRKVAKATGFACQRVRTQGQSLDVLVPGDARNFINQERPYGVEEMVALDKQTVRITYDARLIGARDLLQNTFDAPIILAPPRPYAELESGGKH